MQITYEILNLPSCFVILHFRSLYVYLHITRTKFSNIKLILISNFQNQHFPKPSTLLMVHTPYYYSIYSLLLDHLLTEYIDILYVYAYGECECDNM